MSYPGGRHGRRAWRVGSAALIAALIGALAAGCSSTSSLVEGSTISVAVAQEFTSANPNTSFGRSSSTNADIALLTGSGFGYLDEQGGVVSDDSFGDATVMANDPLTVKYTVGAGVTWSDGVPVDAADLFLAWAANSGRVNTPDFTPTDYVDAETGTFTSGFPSNVVYFDGTVGSGLQLVSRVPEISDDGRSLTVHFDTYLPDWRTAIAPGRPAHIVARHALKLKTDVDAATAKSLLVTAIAAGAVPSPSKKAVTRLGAISRFWNESYNFTELPKDRSLLVSSGPYAITGLVDHGAVTLTANPQYRGSRVPTFEKIVVRVSPDPLETVSLLAKGSVDIASPQPSADVLTALRKVDGVTVTSGSEATFEHLELQISGSRSGAFADPRVRAAFLHVVPRQRIVDDLVKPIDPQARLVNSFTIRPGSEGYKDSVASNGSDAFATVDVDAAKALLAEAGVTAPTVCILYDPANPRRVSEFQLIRTSAAQAGFTVTDCSSSDWQGLLGVNGAYDAALFAWDTTRLSEVAASAVFRSDSTLGNFSHYASDAADAILDELASTDDPATQTTLLTRLDARLWGDAYGVPLFAYPTVTAVSDRVQGVSRSPLARSVFWNAWEWTPR
ncbi:MAG TPA: ABC transporter family substrate-binding protein [Pseudolysinimonas sp.]|nr:ABC transporter family substrate-binding protein [Pseudolysinimonas sp.]